jgi:hypothetical protein
MIDKSLGRLAVIVVAGALAVAGGLVLYNRYVEPQNDGPMERAGESIDDALDGK